MSLEEDNAALRHAVETRLAATRGETTVEMSPMVASLAGCKPAMEAAAAALSDPYSEWVPPVADQRAEAVAGFRRIVEDARPAREARTAVLPSSIEVHQSAHPSSQAFFDLCDKLKALHASKSLDYGSETDPLANIRDGAEFVGIEPWRGAMVRLSDKVTRLRTYCRTGRLEHESVTDNLMDLASYSLLALLMHQEDTNARSHSIPAAD
jgi:hypothetical protein